MAKVNLEPSRAATDNEKAFSKMITCDATQIAARKDNSQQQGNNLNEGDKVNSEVYYKGEAEEEIRCPQPHSDLYPKQSSGDVGPSHNMGPLLMSERCKKKKICSVAQHPKETPDKYSKVYVRQRHPLNKPCNMQSVEKKIHLQEEDDDMQAITDKRDKTHNPSHFEADSRLKSQIICSKEVMEEAHQLWDVGKSIGMEAETEHSDFIQHYANMESRDRKEAMELGNRKAHT